MRKHILLTALLVLALVLLSSCQTVLSIPYTQPSNIDMSQYRNVAVASASRYDGYQSLPSYVRYDSYSLDPRIIYYNYMTSYNYDSINQTTATELTKMVGKVFSSSSYYSTLSTDKTDTYLSLYRIGKDPSALLKADGIDALIIPKITSLKTDEYIDAEIVKDYRGYESVRYTFYRTVSLSFTLTVLDTSTSRIVAVKEYRTSSSSWETFDPNYYIFYSLMSEQDLVEDALSDKISEIVSDFIPTRRYTDVTFKDNNPKLESVEEAYKAAENGNLDYALTVFRKAYEEQGHVPSGYNAALITAAGGDLDGAISILSDIRGKGKDDSEVNYLYSKLLSLKQKNEEAKKQYEPKTTESSTSVSPYEYLL